MELQRWEDRGYYAMKERMETAQRKLHKMQRKASAALTEPAATVLATAAKAIGLADLAAPDSLPGQSVQKRHQKKPVASPSPQDFSAQVLIGCQHLIPLTSCLHLV